MSGTGNQDELIANFANVTGVEEERSRFYLEAAGWELDLAVANFYDGEQDEGAESSDVVEVPNPNDSTPQPGGALQGLLSQTRREPAPVKKPKAEKHVPRSGLVTLDSIRNQREDDSSDEDEKGQAFYTGGSMTSGQQVLGPPPKKKDEFIKDLFEKAREHGASADEPEVVETRGGPSFGGAGYKLGDTSGAPSQTIPASSAPAAPESREVILRLWSSGFTIDDGELRPYTDPTNLEFLNSIKSGEIPRELIRNNHGREVQLAMEDRRTEDYKPPKPQAKPFGGRGQMLGSPAPTVVGSAAQMSETEKAKNESTAREQISLVEGEPATNIQFRLADGSRLVGRFNHTHTVNDLHTFINTARPQYSASNYILTLFPNTDLTAKEVTVKDANLLNAALIQKIK